MIGAKNVSKCGQAKWRKFMENQLAHRGSAIALFVPGIWIVRQRRANRSRDDIWKSVGGVVWWPIRHLKKRSRVMIEKFPPYSIVALISPTIFRICIQIIRMRRNRSFRSIAKDEATVAVVEARMVVQVNSIEINCVFWNFEWLFQNEKNIYLKNGARSSPMYVCSIDWNSTAASSTRAVKYAKSAVSGPVMVDRGKSGPPEV